MWRELSLPFFVIGILGILLLKRRLAVLLYGFMALTLIFSWAYRYGNWYQVILPVYPLILLGVAAVFDWADRTWMTRIEQKTPDSSQEINENPLNPRSILLLSLIVIAIVWRIDASLPEADSRNRLGDTALDHAAILLDQPLPAPANLFAAVDDALALCPFFSREARGLLSTAAQAGALDETFPHLAQSAQAARDSDRSSWFPFSLPWADDSPSWVDASDLLLDHRGQDPSAVIDARGFVRTDSDGHFVFSNSGRRARFWGTNLSFGANFPPCPDFPPQADLGEIDDIHAAEKLAAQLARLGFNAVRLHHMDRSERPRGIWLDAGVDTQQIDPVQLGRLDYFVYQLKQHGIYVDLNLHVSRVFTPSDGVTYADALYDSGISYDKGATLFDPVMIALQLQYARQLLQHVNPYTGLRYAEDPLFLTTETTNEDSFFLAFAHDALNYDPTDPESMPAFYSRELDGWTKVSGTGPTINRLMNPGFESQEVLGDWYLAVEGNAAASFTADADSAEGDASLRIDVSRADETPWHVQLGQDNLALLEGEVYSLSFAVRASEPTTIRGSVTQSDDPWEPLGWGADVAVTTDWVTHTVTFTAPVSTFGGAQVSFELGQAPRTVWFDAFQLHEVEAFRGWLGWLEDRYGSSEALAAAWAAVDEVPEAEMLVNRGFELGLDGWGTQSVTDATDASWELDETQATEGDQSLRVEVKAVDGTSWHVQFWQEGLRFVAGRKYRFSFDARADTAGAVGYNAMQAHAPWHNLGMYGTAELTDAWQHFEAVFEATADDANGRVSFTVGQAPRTLWFDNISLTPFNPRGLLPGESLETNNVLRLRRSQMDAFTAQRVRDTLQFYYETEARYFAAMRHGIQNDLGSRSLNTGTASYIDSLPDIRAMAELDFVDNHFYWDHPSWPGVPSWSSRGWVIGNKPWVNQPFAGVLDTAITAVKGKPFTVTEFNEVFPNRHAVEGPLVMATVANLQDWDAVFMYTYTHDQRNYDADRVTGFFDLAGNPTASALMLRLSG
jgi:hypothetical protein